MLRSLGSFGSDLCEMQRFRDQNIAVTLKDAEWQRRILGTSASTVNPAPHFRKPPVQPNQIPQLSQMETLQQLNNMQPLTYLQHPHSLYQDVIIAQNQRPQQQILPESISRQADTVDNNNQDQSVLTSPSSSPTLKPQATTSTINSRGRKTRSGRVGKIRRHRMTKEEEARFETTDLTDLSGSTAAKSRKMSEGERDIMLHKRRLRNRASAARSRDKQRKTIGELGEEMDQLFEKAQALQTNCEEAQKTIIQLREENEKLKKENAQLRKNSSSATVTTPSKMRRNGSSTLKISMSSDMLDKLIATTGTPCNETKLTTNRTSSGLLRIPSKLHLSLSTDKLSEGLFPCAPLSRNVSLMERLFDFNNASANGITTGETANDDDVDADVHSVTFPRNLG